MRCRAILIATGVVVSAASANGQGGITRQLTPTPNTQILDRMQTYCFRNLSKVSVEINARRADAEVREWTERSKLKEHAEADVRAIGLTVVDGDAWAAADLSIPLLQIQIYSVPVSSGGRVYAINLFLQEGILLLSRNAGSHSQRSGSLLGATWTATNIRFFKSSVEYGLIAEDVDWAVALLGDRIQEGRRLYDKKK